jgi:small subunit ribosomal protein S16
MGRKKLPFYRVVVADSRMPRDGRIIEMIGFYDPKTEPSVVEIDKEKAGYWLSQGATPSNTVNKLLAIAGVIETERKLKKPKAKEVKKVKETKEKAEE